MKSRERQMIQDADEFLQTMKKFNMTPELTSQETEKTSGPVGSDDTPEQVTPSKLSFPTPFIFGWPVKEFNLKREAITFVETFWNEHKKLPGKLDFDQHFEAKDLPKTPDEWQLLLVDITPALESRGIRPYETPLEYLEPNFVLAVSLICNPHDKRSVPAKLKDADLTTKQWQTFLRVENHRAYFQKRLDEIFNEDMVNDAKLALQKMIVAGDLQAIKHFHELQDIYRPQQDTNANVLKILQAIMEILSMHVAPDVLGKVANDIRNSSIINSTAI